MVGSTRRLVAGFFMVGGVVLAVACGSSGEFSEFADGRDDSGGGGSSGSSGGFGTPVDGGSSSDVAVADALDCDADPVACLPPGICGDGKPGLGESCDDGNAVAGDGCSATCQVEGPYWACAFGVRCVDVRDCSDAGDAGDAGCVVPPKPAVCGDGTLDPGEACDDSNVAGGDGCSFDCKAIEANFACPTPGSLCVSTVVCGDTKITGGEQCDDGNALSNDGCSATCQLEAGWTCPLPGVACSAKQCGDGLRAGAEECDDGNNANDDGCSSTCRLQPRVVSTAPTTGSPGGTVVTHYDCAYPATPLNPVRQVCTPTVCGNGVREGTEQCDDGAKKPYDGCSPDCTFEPTCPNGSCVAKCGDGLLFDFDADGDGKADEDCDDGNTRDGDGCSSTCKVEQGYQCTPQVEADPPFIDIPVVLRDFKAWVSNQNDSHPDFETYGCAQATKGLVQTSLVNGVPVLATDGVGTTCGRQLTSATDFTDWYRDITINGVLRSKRFDDVTLRLTRSGAAGNYSYAFDSANDEPYKTRNGFYPLDARGWGNQGEPHNYWFTTELRYWFTYDATKSPSLDFSGDDDVWVFVNGKLALDIGGLHPRVADNFVLDAAKAASLGLVDKRLYEIALFHAERHTNASNFWLTLRGFVKKKSVCTNVCGDGFKTREEQCDLGTNNAPLASVPYGGCTTSCTLGPYCGDGTAQNPPEVCDDGVNLTPYTKNQSSTACGPSCKRPTYCGDGIVQGAHGEQCDDGPNNQNAYGKCQTDCTAGPRCGDGVVQAGAGEECDNGFNVSSYVRNATANDCAPGCKKPRSCGDGTVDFPFEQCDQGSANSNAGAYGSCKTDCTYGPRCGDGIVQAAAGEQCDDGNRVNGDGCSAACLTENGGPK